MSRYEVNAVSLNNPREDEERLHHGHVCPHAEARAAPERKIGMSRPIFGPTRVKPLRVERLRILPELRAAVYEIRTEEYC